MYDYVYNRTFANNRKFINCKNSVLSYLAFHFYRFQCDAFICYRHTPAVELPGCTWPINVIIQNVSTTHTIAKTLAAASKK